MAYKIELSLNMLIQGFTPPRRTFSTEMKAYEYGIAKWGSGTYNDKVHGWYIVEVEG